MKRSTTAHGLIRSCAPAAPAGGPGLLRGFVRAHGADMGEITTAAADDAIYIVHLVLRLHAQHNDSDIRRRCLDLIDQLVAIRAHGIDQDLASIER
jgi:hypothetical protein